MREVARPARCGRREQTLLDPNIRDTWEVPRDRVVVDEHRWNPALRDALEVIRTGLGLGSDCELSAQLHSMLVYEPGQFFRRHQDSEKTGGMIGTLVVTLASPARQLRTHFTTPLEPVRPGTAPRPPRQLVYPLDHQYSRHSFGWDLLKGCDAARTSALRAAAERAGCDVSLALAEVEHAYEEDDYTMDMLIYRQRWERVEDGWKCVESSEVDFGDDDEMIAVPEDLRNRSRTCRSAAGTGVRGTR